MMEWDEILERIQEERTRQNGQWDFCHWARSAADWMAVLTEEVGEACHESLEGSDRSFTIEMIQVAAVAIAILEEMGVVGPDA